MVNPTLRRLLVQVQIPISIGELLDKISILEIKQEKITNRDKLKNIINELSSLESVMPQLDIDSDRYVQKLKTVNKELWTIEDAIRKKERYGEFDDEFIELARAVYYTNDERYAIKQEINQITDSDIQEEKSYDSYR